MTPISPYIPFTQEQKEQAAATDLAVFLESWGERLIQSGWERRSAGNHSVTVRGEANLTIGGSARQESLPGIVSDDEASFY